MFLLVLGVESYWEFRVGFFVVVFLRLIKGFGEVCLGVCLYRFILFSFEVRVFFRFFWDICFILFCFGGIMNICYFCFGCSEGIYFRLRCVVLGGFFLFSYCAECRC